MNIGFVVTTLYGAESKQSLVQVDIETPGGATTTMQLTPASTRELALNLLQAAESAIQDGFMMEYFDGILHDKQKAAAILREFRAHRARYGHEPDTEV